MIYNNEIEFIGDTPYLNGIPLTEEEFKALSNG